MFKKKPPGRDFPYPLCSERQLRRHKIAFYVLVAVFAVVAVFVGLVVYFGENPSSTPPHELSIQKPLYWVPTPPVQDPYSLAVAVGAAFAFVLFSYLDLAYLLIRWTRVKMGQPATRLDHWLATIPMPALGQPALRAATFFAGIIGICLWHYGVDSLSVLPAAITMIWMLGLMGALLWGFTGPWRCLRASLSVTLASVQFYVAVAVAGWALSLV